ncbi:hypothetical protein GWI33_011157, partial [Rhynchophorus ferrugineus]
RGTRCVLGRIVFRRTRPVFESERRCRKVAVCSGSLVPRITVWFPLIVVLSMGGGGGSSVVGPR